MPRPRRLDPNDTWHHVMNRGARRRAVFIDDRDRHDFVQLLGQFDDRFDVEVHLFCLVDNHFHVLVRSNAGQISAAMKFLSERFTRRHNDRHGFDGAAFRGRFHSRTVTVDDHFVWLFRYIHANARDTGWVGPLASYPWSSLGAYVNDDPSIDRSPIPWLRTEVYGELFGWDSRRMIRFADGSQPVQEGDRVLPIDTVECKCPSHVGPIHGCDHLGVLERVIATVLDRWQLWPSAVVQGQAGTCSEARMAVALVAIDTCGVPTSLVSAELSLSGAGSCRMLLGRARKRAATHPSFAAAVREVEQVVGSARATAA